MPRPLLGAAAVAAAVILGSTAYLLTAHLREQSVAATAQADPTAAPPSPTSTPAAASTTAPNGSTTTSAAASALTHDPARLTVTVLTAFCQPTLDAQVWLAGFQRYLAPAVEDQWVRTDPANVPCTKINGAPSVVGDKATPTQTAYSTPTDAGAITISLTRVSASDPWAVAAILPPQS